jgi:hypothetical protein
VEQAFVAEEDVLGVDPAGVDALDVVADEFLQTAGPRDRMRDAVLAPEKILLAVESCACVSRPMTISQFMVSAGRSLPPRQRRRRK